MFETTVDDRLLGNTWWLYAIVLSTLIAVLLESLLRFSVGSVSVTGADLVTAVFGAATVFLILKQGEVRFPRYAVSAVSVLALFTLLTSVNLFRSPQPVRGVTWLLLFSETVVVVAMTTLFSHDLSVDRLNRAIVAVGVLVSLVGLALYGWAMSRYQTIVNNPQLWEPNHVYELGKGGEIRLEFFATDPNFYAIYLSLPLFATLFSDLEEKYKIICSIIILSNVFLTFSRGVVGGLLVALIFTLIVRRTNLGQIVLSTLSGSVAILLLLWVRGSLASRGIAAVLGTRYDLWTGVLDSYLNGGLFPLLFGYGPRSAEAVLEGRYPHNTYLGILHDAGAVGLLLLGTVVVVILRDAVSEDHETDRLPWIAAFVLQLSTFLFYSLATSHLFWLTTGVLLGTMSPTRR